MKDKSLFAVGALILVLSIYYFKQQTRHSKISESVETEVDLEADAYKPVPSQAVPSGVAPTVSQTKIISGDATGSFAESIPPVQISEVVKLNYSKHLQALEKCLNIPNIAGGAGDQLDSERLINAIKSNLGDSVVQLDDWTQWDLVDKSGVKKRIRVDIDYPDGATPHRRLAVFTLNSYGALEYENLTDDQSENPNLAYIESYEEGAKMLVDEKSSRLYFSMGEEFIYSLKNGFLDSISLARGTKVFSCTGLTVENSTCSCP